ncbi:MAG: ATP-binding protein [Thermoplasmata archaeon]|nr:ATP-binding protein [Thermoplasmata archaeon]
MTGRTELIGRERELEELERRYAERHPLVAVSGRPRVGKSALINEFVRGKDAIHYAASCTRSEDHLREFSADVCRALGTPPARYATWSDAIGAYVDGRPGRKVLVFDDVQNIVSEDRGFLRMLRSELEGRLSGGDVMVILCGSGLPFMRRIVRGADSPLHGMFPYELRLEPIRFGDTVRGNDYRRSVEEYAVTGGVPYYM